MFIYIFQYPQSNFLLFVHINNNIPIVVFLCFLDLPITICYIKTHKTV